MTARAGLQHKEERARARLGENAALQLRGDRHAADVATTTPETALADAADTMLRRKVGCLPVVEDGRLVGILSESDFLKLAAR